LRRHGDHSAANGLDLCFSCHARVHSGQPPFPDHPEVTMYDLGFLVHSYDEPAEIPVGMIPPI
jgi:hypothetical protein